MNPFLRIASIAGVTVTAVGLLATPALAGPQMVAAGAAVSAPSAKPAVKITPVRLTLRHYQHAGLVAHLTGFPATTAVDAGWGTSAMGDYIGSYTTSAQGATDIHFLPAKNVAQAGTYSFTVNYQAAASTSTSASTTDSGTAAAPATTTETVRVPYTVKALDSKVAWGAAHRSGTRISLKSTVSRWSATAKKYVPWHSATVKFQERIGGVWKTKTTATTNTKGVAAKTVSAKVHTWRALVVGTKTTWGTTTKTHKK